MGFNKEEEKVLKALVAEMIDTKKKVKKLKEEKKQTTVSFEGIINKIIEEE